MLKLISFGFTVIGHMCEIDPVSLCSLLVESVLNPILVIRFIQLLAVILSAALAGQVRLIYALIFSVCMKRIIICRINHGLSFVSLSVEYIY